MQKTEEVKKDTISSNKFGTGAYKICLTFHDGSEDDKKQRMAIRDYMANDPSKKYDYALSIGSRTNCNDVVKRILQKIPQDKRDKVKIFVDGHGKAMDFTTKRFLEKDESNIGLRSTKEIGYILSQIAKQLEPDKLKVSLKSCETALLNQNNADAFAPNVWKKYYNDTAEMIYRQDITQQKAFIIEADEVKSYDQNNKTPMIKIVHDKLKEVIPGSEIEVTGINGNVSCKPENPTKRDSVLFYDIKNIFNDNNFHKVFTSYVDGNIKGMELNLDGSKSNKSTGIEFYNVYPLGKISIKSDGHKR